MSASVPPSLRARVAAARSAAPELIGDTSWLERLVDDPELVGALIREMMRLDQGPTQRGTRTTPDVAAGMRRWREITRTDYSTAPFPAALANIIAGDTAADIEARTGTITEARARQLLAGRAHPDLDEIVALADAYDVSPWWFHHYRVSVIAGAVAAILEDDPERTAVIIARHTST